MSLPSKHLKLSPRRKTQIAGQLRAAANKANSSRAAKTSRLLQLTHTTLELLYRTAADAHTTTQKHFCRTGCVCLNFQRTENRHLPATSTWPKLSGFSYTKKGSGTLPLQPESLRSLLFNSSSCTKHKNSNTSASSRRRCTTAVCVSGQLQPRHLERRA